MKSSHDRRSLLVRALPLAAAALILASALPPSAQELRSVDRTRGKTMLKVVKKELQNHYYDPTFHGLDLEARFRKAEADLEQAGSLGQVFGIIAQAVLDLNDSHTRFIPPSRTAKFEYGWRLRAVGETPHIIAVKPGSDAQAKGLKVGDAVLSVDGNTPTRKNLGIFKYRYYLVRPAPAMRMLVQSPGGPPRQIDVATKVDMGKRVVDLTQGEDYWEIIRQLEGSSDEQRTMESPDKSILIWNIPSFAVSKDDLKQIAGRFNKYRSVVIDLRGNSGGYLDSLTCLLGFLFDHDVTVGQPVGREKNMKAAVAKTQGERVFTGKVVVVVDSDSASASELFARAIQLEKRGVVVGDRTAGAVMGSRVYSRQMGGETVVLYGISITEMDLIMKDGQSLEKVGVTPDVAALPTGADIAAGRDPVLARAVAEAGGALSPEEAGKMFPYKWRD